MNRRHALELIASAFALSAVAGCTESKPQFKAIDLTGADYAKDFHLTDQNGQPRSLADFRGKVVVLFFGYTQCPDVCPTTMADLAQAKKALGADGDKLQVLFVTVDPERDTPQVTGDYAHYFSADTIAASPTPEQLAAFAKTLGLVYMKVSEPDGSYSMDHSATLVLLDPQGRQAGLLSPPLDPQKIADDLRLLAERAP